MPAQSSEKPEAAAFRPYVAAEVQMAESTPRAVALGALLGVIFGAVSVYLALKAGLTVSASIPVAVLSVSIFKWLGLIYKFLMGETGGLSFWKAQPEWHPSWYPGATVAGEITPEYLGVGYIIGPKVAGTMFAGGVISWLVLIPLIKFFGSQLPEAIYPGTVPISKMAPLDVWRAYS